MSFLIEVENHSNQTVVGFLLVYCSADNLLQISPGFQGLYVCFLCHFVEQDHCRRDCSGSVLGLRGCQPSQSVLCKQYNDRIPNVLADFDCHHSNCQIPNSLRLVLNLLVHVLRFWTWNAYSGMCELGLGPCHLRLWNFSGFASAAIIRLWKRALLSRQRDKRGTPSTLPVVLKQIKSLQGSCFLLLKWCWSKFEDEWVTSHVCSQVLVGGLDPVRRVTYGILCRDVVCFLSFFPLSQVFEAVRSFNIFGSWTTAAICVLFLLATLSLPLAQLCWQSELLCFFCASARQSTITRLLLIAILLHLLYVKRWRKYVDSRWFECRSVIWISRKSS